MEWLDETIKKYEELEKQKKDLKKEEERKMLSRLTEERKKATKVIDEIYKCFVDCGREIKRKGYPCNYESKGGTDAQTGEQFNSEAILFLKKWQSPVEKKFTTIGSSYLSFKASGANIVMAMSIDDGQSEPKRTNLKMDSITTDFINEKIKEFVQGVFAA